LLRGAASLVRTPAAARGITIRVAKTDGEAVALFADAARLRQSLRTILTCALRQAGPGAITLAAEAATDPAQPIRLVVRDSGPALTAEQASRLFAPLSQFVLPPDGEADAGWAGSALDLAVCHELIVRMGGQMGWQAWRTPDGQDGNMVWLSLPASALPAPPAPGTPAPAAAARTRVEQADMRLPRTRILLAEDVVANQIVAATLLRREGHMVDIAVDGLAAVEALRNTPYDVVFMDIMMPGMNGRDAAAAIRLLPEPARSVPIIALTADTSGGDETSFRAAGMNAMLGKPVALPELLNAMRIHAWSRSPQDVVPDAQPAGEQTGADRPAAAPETRSSGVPAGQAGALPAPIATSPREPVLATERLAELRGNLPPATFVALIEECLTDLDSRLPALRRAFATGSPGAITAHSHAMVGMAAGYGMAALEARLRRVTAAARAGDLTPLGPDVMPQIEADLAGASNSPAAVNLLLTNPRL
jgi:CheY-like chemotaxis protein